MEKGMRNCCTVVVLFKNDITSYEINDYLEDLDVEGTEVSAITKTYAIEVPSGKEKLFLHKFAESDLVKYVCPYVLEGRKSRR